MLAFRRWLQLLSLVLLPAPAWAAGPIFTVNSLADVPGGGDLTDRVCETAAGNGVCTLRAAVMEANHTFGGVGGATIRLPAGTYVLTIPHSDAGHEEDGDLNLLATMTIEGEGPSATIIDGNQLDHVFYAYLNTPGSTVTLKGLTIRNGRAPSGQSTDFGGGIWNAIGTTMTLENVVVANNYASDAAGIYNSGTLEIDHSIIRGNQGVGSGGILSDHTAIIRDSQIDANSAYGAGGVLNDSTMTIERSLITSNSSFNGFGGGVEDFGTLTMVNDTVRSNAAAENGGGLFVRSGSAQLINVTVSGNFAGTNHQGVIDVIYGAGVDVDPTASLFLKNSIIAGNHRYSPDGSDDCGTGPILSGDYNLIGATGCPLSGVAPHDQQGVDPLLSPLHYNGGFAMDQAPARDPSSATSPAVDAIPPASCTDALGGPLLVDGRGYARSGNCDIGAHETLASFRPAQPLGTELILNGGAEGNELGEASNYPPLIPNWSEDGDSQMTQALYGSQYIVTLPSKSDAPAGSGSYVFTGGLFSLSTMSQSIDVSALAGQIDAGGIRYRVSGEFGGQDTDQSIASLDVAFRSDAAQLQDVTIGGFTPADRGNVTRLLPDSATGTVPPGTRVLAVTLSESTVMIYNDAYADDLSVTLPEPSMELGGAASLIPLVLLGMRRLSSRRAAAARRRSPSLRA